MLLMLQSSNAARRLKRIVRDEDGQTVDSYEFAPGIAVDVDEGDIQTTPSILKDLRNGVLVAVNEQKERLDIDWNEAPRPKSTKKGAKKPDAKKTNPPKTNEPPQS